MGVRTDNASAAVSSVQTAPLTKATDGSGGREWLLIPLGALALALLVILAIARTEWHWIHPFGTRHVRAR